MISDVVQFSLCMNDYGKQAHIYMYVCFVPMSVVKVSQSLTVNV